MKDVFLTNSFHHIIRQWLLFLLFFITGDFTQLDINILKYSNIWTALKLDTIIYIYIVTSWFYLQHNYFFSSLILEKNITFRLSFLKNYSFHASLHTVSSSALHTALNEWHIGAEIQLVLLVQPGEYEWGYLFPVEEKSFSNLHKFLMGLSYPCIISHMFLKLRGCKLHIIYLIFSYFILTLNLRNVIIWNVCVFILTFDKFQLSAPLFVENIKVINTWLVIDMLLKPKRKTCLQLLTYCSQAASFTGC